MVEIGLINYQNHNNSIDNQNKALYTLKAFSNHSLLHFYTFILPIKLSEKLICDQTNVLNI